MERDLQAIYSGVGLTAEFTYLPDERALQAVISGQYDALDMRTTKLDDEKDLVKVNVPLASFNAYLFTVSGKFYNNLDEIKDEIVVSFHGARYARILKNYKRLYLIHSPEQAALMLKENRASVWLAPEVTYLFLKKKYPKIQIASPVIYQGNLYHYIHISKAHLLKKIEASARAYMMSKSLSEQ